MVFIHEANPRDKDDSVEWGKQRPCRPLISGAARQRVWFGEIVLKGAAAAPLEPINPKDDVNGKALNVGKVIAEQVTGLVIRQLG